MVNLYHTASGNYWLPDPEKDCVLHAIINNHVWDNNLVQFVKSKVLPDSVILDVGGNFGQMAVLFSKIAGHVHVFEAEPFIYTTLVKNLSENNCNNVTAHQVAVWHETGLDLFYPKADFNRFDSWGSYGIDPTAMDGQPIKSITIDSLNLPKVDLIKIDIQGSDLNAMKGAVNTISKFKPTIIFEYEPLFNNQFNVKWEDYIVFIYNIGYQITDNIDAYNFVIEPK